MISIIAVITSVVLASLGNARKRSNDTKVKAQLDGVRKNAALYFSANGNYGISYNFCVLQGSEPTQPFFQDSVSGMSIVTASAIYPAGTILECRSNGQAYAVAATLSASTPGNVIRWCVDSTGASKQIGSKAFSVAGATSCDTVASVPN